MIKLNKLKIERHDGIDVVREDLCCDELPSGKLRGLLPWFSDLKRTGLSTVVNHGATKSNSHAIVAFAARETGINAVTLVNGANPTPATTLAAEFGAKVIYAGPMHLSPLRSRAAKIKQSIPEHKSPCRILPWGLAHPEMMRFISELCRQIKQKYYDYHVVPIGAGGYSIAVADGVRKYDSGTVIGVAPKGGYKIAVKHLANIQPNHKVFIEEGAAPKETPFPSDPNYEWHAWPVAERLARMRKKVLFWNVGVPLC